MSDPTRATDELLVLCVLERFLYRVSVCEHRDRLVLKGGMLLAALDQRRRTRDVDLLALGLGNDIDTVIELVAPILQVDVDDGVEFHDTELAAGGDPRPGCLLGRARRRAGHTWRPPASRSRSTSTWATPSRPHRPRSATPRCWANRSRWWATPSRRSWPRSWSPWSSVLRWVPATRRWHE